jgi:hypothetical protein
VNDLTIDHLERSSAVAIFPVLDAKIDEHVTKMQDIVNVIFLKAGRKRLLLPSFCSQREDLIVFWRLCGATQPPFGMESSFGEKAKA